MARYPNTLGVLVADGLIVDDESALCTPVLAAVVRDVKKHMRLKHYATEQRVLPIGYGAMASDLRDQAVLEYLSSGEESSRIDFWTVNVPET